MRGTAVMLLAVVLCGSVGCDSGETDAPRASTTASAKVPDITDFRCPAKPSTTFDLEVCGAQRTERLERAIDAEVRSIVSRHLSATARARFRRSRHAWLAYRKALCESRRDVFEGGSAARVVFIQCMADESARHLEELRTFNRDLRRGRE
jgi:uncharacterized protein YecT (DUF1311 family)